jgi:GDP/UDP-N,N'-diacetylbacillosamine 2-epimerase (hydrolysing)
MKIAILTSSRADFGIYIPLVNAFLQYKNIDLEIIAFGTHLSEKHGNTIDKKIYFKNYFYKNTIRK